MTPASVPTPPPAERQWFIAGRWQEYEGEARANLLRVLAVATFYAIHLISYHGLRLGVLEVPRAEDVNRSFHLAVTALAAVWTLTALAVALCLRQHFFPAGMKFASTAMDLVLLTWILLLGDGPRSSLIVGYFLVIGLAGLRFNLPLVWFATAGAAGGYLFLLGYARWFTDRDLRMPRYQQLIVLLALVWSGILLGQLLRRVRSLAEDYSRRLSGGAGGRS